MRGVFLGFIMILLISCGLSMPGSSSLTVVVVEQELHLLFLPSRGNSRGALLYIEPSWTEGLEVSNSRDLQEFLGIRPTRIYVVDDLERLGRFSRLLERLAGFDSAGIFSYGRASPQFWDLLTGHAALLADNEVLPMLEGLYDADQISSKVLGEGFRRLSQLEQPLVHIDAVSPEGSKELLQLQISQIRAGIEGE